MFRPSDPSSDLPPVLFTSAGLTSSVLGLAVLLTMTLESEIFPDALEILPMEALVFAFNDVLSAGVFVVSLGASCLDVVSFLSTVVSFVGFPVVFFSTEDAVVAPDELDTALPVGFASFLHHLFEALKWLKFLCLF